MHAALRAAVPALVCSVDAASDQAYWGGRLVATRLAPAAFAAATVSKAQLANALRACVGDAALRARLQDAARAVAAENAAADAAKIILAAAAEKA